MILHELLVRGFQVDVGVVENTEKDKNGKLIRKRLEVDFICSRDNQRYYISLLLPRMTEKKCIRNGFHWNILMISSKKS